MVKLVFWSFYLSKSVKLVHKFFAISIWS